MATRVIVGTQWGDEGKGCICDVLAADADIIVRYQGGSNAGHTVVVGDQVFKFHLVPSGILREGKLCIMADGTVIDPLLLAREITELAERGIDVSGLRISGAAHVIMPYHPLLDKLEERLRGDHKIGTTARGVGPAYVDKAKRCGIRVWDLTDRERLREKIDICLREKNALLKHLYDAEPISTEQVLEQLLPVLPTIRPYIADTRHIISQALREGKEILFEGAQGTFLDIDYGAYPNVTCSHPVAGGAAIGTGIGPTAIDEVIGVSKAYATRVGSGPFPTELENELGERLRERGQEYGTTTGRPRRCGWLDAVMVRTAVQLNGACKLAITKLDVLDELEKICVAVAYKLDGKTLDYMPGDPEEFARVTPVYEELAGWRRDTSQVRSRDELPEEALAFLNRVGDLVGAPVSIVSLGPERSQTVILE